LELPSPLLLSTGLERTTIKKGKEHELTLRFPPSNTSLLSTFALTTFGSRL
jgi:hypothetical protein